MKNQTLQSLILSFRQARCYLALSLYDKYHDHAYVKYLPSIFGSTSEPYFQEGDLTQGSRKIHLQGQLQIEYNDISEFTLIKMSFHLELGLLGLYI